MNLLNFIEFIETIETIELYGTLYVVTNDGLELGIELKRFSTAKNFIVVDPFFAFDFRSMRGDGLEIVFKDSMTKDGTIDLFNDDHATTMWTFHRKR